MEAMHDPTPTQEPIPPTVPEYAINAIKARSADELEKIAKYCERLADYKRAQAADSAAGDHDDDDRGLDDDQEEAFQELDESDDPADYDGVPAKAYRTVKPINDHHYFYWQWRDGDKIKSEYIAPVHGGE